MQLLREDVGLSIPKALNLGEIPTTQRVARGNLASGVGRFDGDR
jgi:hypothetical protein